MHKDKPKGSLISYFSELVKKEGGINLAQGKPGFAPPRQLLAILKRRIKDKNMHQYAPGNGDSDLLDMLAKQFSCFFNKLENLIKKRELW
jgi:aspartate/methionine/tyrosine aminotransferase